MKEIRKFFPLLFAGLFMLSLSGCMGISMKNAGRAPSPAQNVAAKAGEIGRYQIVVVPDSDGGNKGTAVKIDTQTGKAWKLEGRNWSEIY